MIIFEIWHVLSIIMFCVSLNALCSYSHYLSSLLFPVLFCSVLSLSLHDPPHTLCQYHLISYPSSPQFLYSAGRTGRAGRKGLVTAIIAKRDKVLSDAIQVCIWVEPPLHCTALYCTALYHIVLSCAVQHYPRHTILTILWCALLYCTVLYYTAHIMPCVRTVKASAECCSDFFLLLIF